MPWDDNLAKDQPAYAIAKDEADRIRVLAGPGTGKSFAMNRRVARLLEGGTPPKRLLAVTFTRMAAEDLVREIRSLEIEGSSDVAAGTLHALCFRILGRKHVIELTGRHPRALAKYEQKPLMHDLKALGLGGIRDLRKEIRAYEAAWARLQHDAPGAAALEELSFESALINWLRFHRAMLIGELVPFAYHYLAANEAAPERTMFDEVLVDEYQDLNKAEQEVITLLASHGRIVVVGDDDQSIYSFKHAHPAGIQEFGAADALSDHSLRDSHRSPARVVAMANRLIAHNSDRIDPKRFLAPIPTKGEGVVTARQFSDLSKEADWLRDEIVAEIEAGVPVGQIIVLCPNRFLARPLQRRLEKDDVPVRFCFEEHELDNESAALRLAILGWIADREDRVPLRYLVGVESQTWRANEWRKVVETCRAEGKSPRDLLDEILAGRKLAGVKQVAAKYKSLLLASADLEGLTGEKLVSKWLEAPAPAPGADDPLRDLRSLAAEQVVIDGDVSPGDLYALILEQITQPEVPDEVAEVRIMSLHKSKGLSANVVVVTGLVEGAVPRHPQPGICEAEADEFTEEQRRLFYVAITRVKAQPEANRPGRLILSSVHTLPTDVAKRSSIPTISDYAGVSHVTASRFLGELGPLK